MNSNVTKAQCLGRGCNSLEMVVNEIAGSYDGFDSKLGDAEAIRADGLIIGACILKEGCFVENSSDKSSLQIANFAESILNRRALDAEIRSRAQGGIL
jgi:hypothetical protein